MTDKTANDLAAIIYEQWQDEIQDNEHFSEQSFVTNDAFHSYSKDFLGKLTHAIDKIELPDFSNDSINGVFQFWSAIHKDHQLKGLSAKDTAMLIFSIKSSLMSELKKAEDTQDLDQKNQLKKLRNLLDLLGLLTFESYSQEKDQMIERQSEQINYLQDAPKLAGIIGESPEMISIFKAIGLVLENDVSVLLEGESGTGKDLLAQLIHSQSKRKEGPFITLNCAAIPKDLLESELFGHEKGAFTGADQQRLGKFELAHNGTLFLDEIGDMPLDMQSKLLRVIQNREVERVGGSEKINVNVRIIAATHRHLEDQVKKQLFRLDLLYRLNVFPIRVPPLRERLSDIRPLAEHFLAKYSKEYEIPTPTLQADGLAYLMHHDWPGNIRELENLIQRAVILSNGHPISSAILQFKPGASQPLRAQLGTPQTPEPGLIIPLEQLEKKALTEAIKLTKGNVKKAADELGISRTTFYNKAKKYQLDLE